MRFCEVLRGSRFYEVLSHQLGVASAERAHLGTLVGRAVVGRIFVVAAAVAVVATVLVLRLELRPFLPEVVPVLEEAVGVASVELVPVPGWSKAARSATSEVARLSSLGSGWVLTGLASSWAAQSHQAGTLTMLRYRAASSSYRCTQ